MSKQSLQDVPFSFFRIDDTMNINSMFTTISTVEEAIRDASDDLLRDVIRFVLHIPDARAIIEQELLLPVPAAEATHITAGQKRKRYETCRYCHEEYDISRNDDEDCEAHTGDLEVDDEGGFWDDHDEDCHGEIDSEEMREEYPEGFVWTCCNKKGDEEGGRVGKHEPGGERKSNRS
ncbi:Hypothetical protein D9617_11g009250 [Elsinoe fawcettii]|nr:Hypothetical protein D9617_11g009250 [Elsinoe fawcettii]